MIEFVLPMNRVVSAFTLSLMLCAPVLAEKMFVITSDPPGARVQFNNLNVGVAPIERRHKDSVLSNIVTKGIVSAFRKSASYGLLRQRPKPVHKLSPTLAACLPPDVKADEIAVYGFNGARNVTIAEKLKELKGHCHNGRIVGLDKKEIRFFRVTCWGNAPSDYQEIQAEERRKLEVLKAKYRVIVIGCEPRIP